MSEQCKGKCIVKKINTYLRTDQDSFVKVAWKKNVSFCLFIGYHETQNVFGTCRLLLRLRNTPHFFAFVLVTCPVKATQLMIFITGSGKIPLAGMPAAIRVLFKYDCRLGSNGSHCRCLPVVSTCGIFIKLSVHIITERFLWNGNQ